VISVVIPTRDRPRLLVEALQSVAEQTYRDFEVVLVNDGGVPVAPVVRRWRTSLNLTVVELPRSVGVSVARNVAMANATGDFLAFLDDDDVFLPHHLSLAAAALDRPGTDLVYLGALVSDQRIRSLPEDWARLHRKAYAFDHGFLHIANFIHTGSVVVRNFHREGLRFNPSSSYAEDWEMWLGLRRTLGFEFRYLNHLSSVYHQVPGTPGLVSAGQASIPSPFALARQRVYRQWPASNLKIAAYRAWMLAFDERCNDEVRAGRQVPAQIFDCALQYLYPAFVEDQAPCTDRLAGLFDPQPAVAR
jgi:glycosyltransferase involved in cell wall biosynthesis